MKEIDLYIEGMILGKNHSEHTITKYKGNLNKFRNYFNLNSLEDLSKITVQDYYAFYNSQNFKKANSTNDLIRSLSAFFTWLEKSSMISRENSFRKVLFGGSGKFLKVPDEEIELLTDDELERLIKSGSSLQIKTMICMMVFQGFRRGTITEIKVSDIKDCTLIVSGKGKKKRQVSLHKTVCMMLNLYLAERNSDSEYLFFSERGEKTKDGKLTGQSVNNRIKSAGRRAGFSEEKVKKLHAHLLRHVFGTNIIMENGIDVGQQALWHVSKATTKRYDHSGSFLSNTAIINQRDLNVMEE
jgi:site-specific recombinase XerD